MEEIKSIRFAHPFITVYFASSDHLSLFGSHELSDSDRVKSLISGAFDAGLGQRLANT